MWRSSTPVGWPQPVHAVLAGASTLGGLLVWSVLLGRTDRGWSGLIDAFVLSPLINVAVALVATILAILLILAPAIEPGTARWAPLLGMGLLLGAVAGAVLVVAVGVTLAVLLGLWIAGQGTGWLIFALLVYPLLVVRSTIRPLILGGAELAVFAHQLFGTWFGAVGVHPLLPALAKALLAVMQVIVGTAAIATGKGGGDAFLDWLLALAVIGHAGMFVLMGFELRHRLRTFATSPG